MFQILVVDDDRHTRMLLEAILKAENYTVFTADNGVSALEVLDREHVDLVVLDIMMPKMDGYEFTKLLRETNNDPPILMVSARYLPTSLDRVLYLDPDIVVNGDIRELYHLPMDRYYFAAASHTGPFITTVSSLRLDMEEDSPYINSGVMLMNLKRLRAEQDYGEVFDFIKKRKPFLILPDQDIISSLYGSRILALDTYRYNMTDRLFRQHSVFEKNLTLDWVRKNSILIHYCGRNKPWKENDSGQLGIFYQEARKQMEEQILCTG